MPWFKVDDGFYDHPKVALLEGGPCYEAALCLWLLAGSYCAKYLTEGELPRAAIRKFGVTKTAASELVRVGLWEVTETGFRFKDWADYQPGAEEHKAKIATKTARQRRWRQSLQARAAQRDVTRDVGASVDGRVDVYVDASVEGRETGFPIPIPIQEREISDPAPHDLPALSARPPAYARGAPEGLEPETNDPDPAWTQERMGRVFQREWQALRGAWPTLHSGRNPLAARELYESTVETAMGRGMHPETLFVQTLRAWIPTVGKTHSPFAFFAASWTGLLSTDPQEAQRAFEKKLREDCENQLRAVRAGAHNASR